jgi:hypothetical protein
MPAGCLSLQLLLECLLDEYATINAAAKTDSSTCCNNNINNDKAAGTGKSKAA